MGGFYMGGGDQAAITVAAVHPPPIGQLSCPFSWCGALQTFWLCGPQNLPPPKGSDLEPNTATKCKSAKKGLPKKDFGSFASFPEKGFGPLLRSFGMRSFRGVLPIWYKTAPTPTPTPGLIQGPNHCLPHDSRNAAFQA